MNTPLKNNKLYYFCLLSGALLFWGWLFITGGMVEQDDPHFLERHIKFFIILITTLTVIPHFIIRKNIKRNDQTKFRRYVFLLFISALAFSIVETILAFVLTHPFDLPNLPTTKGGVIAFEDYVMLGKFLDDMLFGFMIYSFWLMLYLGISSIRDKKLLAQQLTEQRLTSLMNQINPHFLFNSLNTIRGMIYEDQDKAADLVTQLSSLFRYNLSVDAKGLTSLKKELEVCQQYLAIEDIRLGERLQVELNVSANAMAMQIPTMGLLTLVENAIKHGIAKLKNGGVLTIAAKVHQDKVIIEVSNPYDARLQAAGTEVGLANLKQRIALIYGSEASLLVNKEVDKDKSTFQVLVTLPFLDKESDMESEMKNDR